MFESLRRVCIRQSIFGIPHCSYGVDQLFDGCGRACRWFRDAVKMRRSAFFFSRAHLLFHALLTARRVCFRLFTFAFTFDVIVERIFEVALLRRNIVRAFFEFGRRESHALAMKFFGMNDYLAFAQEKATNLIRHKIAQAQLRRLWLRKSNRKARRTTCADGQRIAVACLYPEDERVAGLHVQMLKRDGNRASPFASARTLNAARAHLAIRKLRRVALAATL